MKEIYLIRHGETEFNRMGMVQGCGIDEPLNLLGLRQAELFYKAYFHLEFDRVYTSALIRSQQSVDRFITNNISHEVYAGLNEISWGDYEGKVMSETQKANFFATINQWKTGDLQARLPNGESVVDVANRQNEVLNLLLTRTDEDRVLICMHGRAMKVFLCGLLGKSLNEMELFPHSNLCLYILKLNGNGKFELVLENNTDHLK
ncbi:MAG: histidine phosphatase family protein [Bacteroidetes bacterium]|nr:histidine phosphatase family protein [Bacteroidota bacterium]